MQSMSKNSVHLLSFQTRGLQFNKVLPVQLTAESQPLKDLHLLAEVVAVAVVEVQAQVMVRVRLEPQHRLLLAKGQSFMAEGRDQVEVGEEVEVGAQGEVMDMALPLLVRWYLIFDFPDRYSK